MNRIDQRRKMVSAPLTFILIHAAAFTLKSGEFLLRMAHKRRR
jgi:hypothetical protein